MTLQDAIKIIELPEVNIQEVKTCVDNWDEHSVNHALIDKGFLYSLVPELEKKEYIEDISIHTNGLVNIKLKNIPLRKKSLTKHHISIHPKKDGNGCFIMKSLNDDILEYESKIIDVIIDRVNQLRSYFNEKQIIAEGQLFGFIKEEEIL